MNDCIKVLVVDDQKDLANEIANIVSTDPTIEVVGVACDGVEALQNIEKTPTDVVLMDIRMPNMNGVVATQQIKSLYPHIKVLILTTFDDSDYILNAINYGASGYLLKDIGASALVSAIRNAHAGDTILPAKIARRITDAAKTVSLDREIRLKKTFGFADRETEIALMAMEGFTNRQISSALKISEGTTRNYISSIYEKTKSENRSNFLQKMKELFA